MVKRKAAASTDQLPKGDVMFKVVITTTKPSYVPFFSVSSPEVVALISQEGNIVKNSPGFISSKIDTSADGNTSVTTVCWESKAHADAVGSANKQLYEELRIKREAYNKANGITRTRKVV